MNIAFALACFFVIWWTVLFAVLPFAGRTQGDAGEVVPGTPKSAPDQPRFGRVLVWTTIVAVVVFAVLYGVFSMGWVSFVPPPQPV